MRVVVDMDQTLVDLITSWLSEVKSQLGLDYDKSDIHIYDIGKIMLDRGECEKKVSKVFDILRCEFTDLYIDAKDEPTFSPILKVIKNHPEVSWILYTKSVSHSMTSHKESWLDMVGINDLFEDQTDSGKSIITSSKDIEADVIIDDCFAYCKGFVEHNNGNSIALMIDQPWNQLDSGDGIMRTFPDSIENDLETIIQKHYKKD